MQGPAPSSIMWQRRTNRLIAAAIIVIGLTMMISNITQCIYIGMVFIVLALVWLARMAVSDRKVEPPRPELHSSPVLFLVTSNMLPRSSGTRFSNPNDKPPSYDQIISLDGLPPDYSSIVVEKLPQYHEAIAASNDVPATSSSIAVTIEEPVEEPFQSEEAPSEIDHTVSPREEGEDVECGGARPKTSNCSEFSSSRSSSLWNTFTRGIAITKSFSLPQKERSRNRTRHFSSTSSSAESCIHKSESIGSALVKLQVPTLQQDVSKYLNSSFDQSEDISNSHSNSSTDTPNVNNLSRESSGNRSILVSSSSSDCFIDDTASTNHSSENRT